MKATGPKPVKAWGILLQDEHPNELLECAWDSRKGALDARKYWGHCKTIPVEIRATKPSGKLTAGQRLIKAAKEAAAMARSGKYAARKGK